MQCLCHSGDKLSWAHSLDGHPCFHHTLFLPHLSEGTFWPEAPGGVVSRHGARPSPVLKIPPSVLTNCRLHSFSKALQTTDASQAQGWALGTQRWPWPPGSIHRATEETEKQLSNNSIPTGTNRGKKAKEKALKRCLGKLGVVASDLT